MLSTRSILTLIAVCVSLLSADPASAADGKVTGRITIKGESLAAGRVIFHLDDGQFVGAKVKDGKYTIDRVPTGARKITVEGNGVAPKYAAENMSGLTLEVKKGSSTFDIVLD
jgi:hypothetical protein